MIARNSLSSEAPSGFPSRRWEQLRRDVTDFPRNRRGRRRQPAAAGPTSTCSALDADRPYTRIDGLGLVPALGRFRFCSLRSRQELIQPPSRSAREPASVSRSA